MTRDRQWIVLSIFLVVLGGLITTYKVVRLGYPIFPEQTSEQWSIQARLEIEPTKGPIRASLLLPVRPSGFTIGNENFISREFGLTIEEDLFRREADWAVRSLRGSKTLYYRATVFADTHQRRISAAPDRPLIPFLEEPWASALTDIVTDVSAESADVESFAAEILDRLNSSPKDPNIKLFLADGESLSDLVKLAQTVLAAAQIPSLQIHGITLQNDVQRSDVKTLLAVWDGSDWIVFDPQTGHEGLPPHFMVWWRGDEDLTSVSGARITDQQISVKRRVASTLDLAEQRTEISDSLIGQISLLYLPVQTQSVYEVLLLVPFGILVIVILRNFIGLSSFGTFAPVLIALAFRETELIKGLLLFVLIVSLGLVFRFYMERLRLLLIPRLAAVVTIVVLLMTSISLVSHRLGIESGLSVSLFPMVIISMVIERMSIVWEERGAATSIREGLGSLLMASLAFSVMSLDLLAYWVTVYPELNLVVLGVIVALGRYTGFRLTELKRFHQLTVQEKP
ncbi:UUP1 family membrane protein [Pseudomonadota bacterium]